jgi:hypothetical protein
MSLPVPAQQTDYREAGYQRVQNRDFHDQHPGLTVAH